MPPGQQSHKDKISKAVNAIKRCGWHTTNEFVESFYSSPQAVQSLHYQPKTDYAPECILTAWMSRVPSDDAEIHLHLAITQKAADIMVLESTRA